MLKLLDLFSGIGGFSLGLESTGGFETIAFVEKDDFCQKVLKKHWPNITIEGDIRNVKGDKYEADVVTGGFPCQPFSVAGKRKGTDDDRYLWDETIRVVRECKPRWFIGENVEGLININNGLVLRQVQTDLEKEGFEVQCLVVPASGVGAWHQRKRIWIMGYSKHNGCSSTKIKGRNDKTNDNSEKGKNQTSEFERTGGPLNNGNVRMDASNSNNTRDRTSQYDIDGRWEKIDERWKELSQSKSSRYSEDVSNSESSRHRGRSSQECKNGEWSFLQGKQKGRKMGSEVERCNGDVSNSESISSNDGRYGNNSKEKQIQFKVGRESSATNVSNSNTGFSIGENKEIQTRRTTINNGSETLSNSNNERLQGLDSEPILQEQKLGLITNKNDEGRETWWQTQSRICGVPNGVSFELDKDRNNRIKSLGNSIVPQIVRQLGFAILEAEK
jgi:DNA (cytosine-5)-methyltransferase 1